MKIAAFGDAASVLNIQDGDALVKDICSGYHLSHVKSTVITGKEPDRTVQIPRVYPERNKKNKSVLVRNLSLTRVCESELGISDLGFVVLIFLEFGAVRVADEERKRESEGTWKKRSRLGICRGA